MTKKGIMITVDEFIHTKAKEVYMNISEVCENAIRNKVKGHVDQAEEERECFSCGSTGGKFTWLCPDEIWLCKKCINKEVKKVNVSVGRRY